MWMRRGVSGGDSVCSRRERFGAPKVSIGLGRSRSEDGLGLAPANMLVRDICTDCIKA